MSGFLANENVPADVVTAVRQAGHDLAWIVELSPGADDDAVLAAALAESRVLLTFDKGFGEMAFRQGKAATCGVVLFRPRLYSPAHVSRFVVSRRRRRQAEFVHPPLDEVVRRWYKGA